MKPIEEFWTSLEKQNRCLRHLSILLGIVGFFMAIALLRLSQRPPFVIRIDPTGQARLLQSQLERAQPEEAEARFFTKEFLKMYLAPSGQTAGKDLSMALAWMESDLREKHARIFRKNQYLQDLLKKKIQVSIFFGELVARKNPKDYEVIAKGVVETRQGSSGKPHRRSFTAMLRLLSVARETWNPYGLHVGYLKITFDSVARIRYVPEGQTENGYGGGSSSYVFV